MSVAYEFLNGVENFSFRNKEEMVNFIIDHYFELMKVYRVMKTQNMTTRTKKETAHHNLQSLRAKEELFDVNTMTETDKIALEETKKQLAILREENDTHYYKGEELEVNQLNMLIINNPRLMELLEHIDSISRIGISKVSRLVIKTILFPVRKLTRSAIDQTEKGGKTNSMLKGLRSLIASLPEIVEESILSSIDVNLNDHRPDIKSNDQQINITL